MTEPLTITVFFDCGRLSPNQKRRMVWQQERRLIEEAKRAAAAGWLRAGRPRSTVPVTVDVTIRRGRRLRDDDNAIGAIKNLRDGLFCGQVTPDDNEAWFRLGQVRQETGGQWCTRPEVVFRVFPRETATASDGGCAALLEEIEEKEADVSA